MKLNWIEIVLLVSGLLISLLWNFASNKENMNISLILLAPTGPPLDVLAESNSSTSIILTWNVSKFFSLHFKILWMSIVHSSHHMLSPILYSIFRTSFSTWKVFDPKRERKNVEKWTRILGLGGNRKKWIRFTQSMFIMWTWMAV